VGAVGHFLEGHGLPTTGISLVRENTAAMRPPRALWVPFPLGRPFGTPHATDFQRDVLRAALELLIRNHGPVLEDFPSDAPPGPEGEETETLVCPVSFPAPGAVPAGSWNERVTAELASLRPWHALATQQGRAAAGVSGLETEDAAALLANFVEGNGDLPTGLPEPAKTLRNAAEDLRAWYAAAITMQPGPKPSATAIADWLWGETACGALLLAAHPVCLAHQDRRVQLVGRGMWVPRAQQHRIGSTSS
jgi:hypothetical protein